MGHPATRFPAAQHPGSQPTRSGSARLAEVIVLDDHRPVPGPGTYLRRRIVAAVALVAVLALVTVLLGRVAATASGPPAVAGHVVVEPGQTLWEVAVDHAPQGTDTRAYLDAIVHLNGLESADVAAWDVVLLPAG